MPFIAKYWYWGFLKIILLQKWVMWETDGQIGHYTCIP